MSDGSGVMQPASSGDSEGPVRLLSIDGGGVRGLSALILLQQLMAHVNNQRKEHGLPEQEPWELFDLMGGTSTGGLIAILLGRLRMPLSQAIDSYKRLSGKAFTKHNILSRSGHKITLGAKFKTEPLENAIHEMIGDDSSTKLLKEESSGGGRPCKVFVTTHLQDVDEPILLRSYRNMNDPAATDDTMLMWQAARATSAALTYFDPITVDDLTYSDGGLYYNNPISHVHTEASEVFLNRKQMIVSLGTGGIITKVWDPTLLNIAEGLVRIATATQLEADNFYKRENGKMAEEKCYFRFNVPELGERDLAESDPKSLANIRVRTEKYLRTPEIRVQVKSCAGSLVEAKFAGVQVNEETRLLISRWLSELDFKGTHQQHVAEREEGTGKISSRLEPEFSYWFNGEQDYVWLRGDPGTGKSTLISSLVEILCLRPNVAIAYLYLEKTHEIVSARNLLACILKQLTEHTGRIAHAILESYGRDPSRKTQPREIQLLDMLVEQARGSERVYIFVDALDRMESRLVFQLLTALNNFQDRAKNVSIIVSSPEISEYRQKLDRAREHEVCANEEEMALFVHHHIERSEDSIMYTMTREDKALESQIQAIVREKAGGMFIMAKLCMTLLASRDYKTKNDFRNSLANLPDAPDEAYRQLWARIVHQRKSDATLAQRIFSWVTFSEQPIAIKDLQYALHLDTNPQSWPFDLDDLTLEARLGSVCLGVIAVKPKTSVIGFVHHTAELFFPRFFATDFADFAVKSQRQIAISCMHYMKLLGRLRLDSDLDSTPLLLYAGVHWATHVIKNNSIMMQDDVVEFLCDIDGLRGAASLLRQSLFTKGSTMRGVRVPVIDNITSLHIAAYFGLVDVAKRLFSRDQVFVEHNADDYWTALRWATINQQFAMVQYLMAQGADIDLEDDEGNNLIMWSLGHDQDSSRLGDLHIWNCSIHVGETYHYRSLEEAAQPIDVVTSESRTSSEILDFLVKNTKSIHTKNKAGLSTLAIAAKHRHLGLVHYLIEKGADVNTIDKSGMTPLLWALQPNQRRELSLANINVWGDACVHVGPHIIIDPSLPVHQGSGDMGMDSSSYESILLMLVGDNLDAKNSHGRTALSLAAEKGLMQLVTVLLKGGADVTPVDDNGMTAYDWAVCPPVAHRTYTKNVNVWGSAQVFIGVQYEYRELDPHSSRAPPKTDLSRNLLAANLRKHMRLRGKQSKSHGNKEFANNLYSHTREESSLMATLGSFALFSHKDQGNRLIESRQLDWQRFTSTWRATIHTWGSSQTMLGIAIKLTEAKPLTDESPWSPVTWMTAFASEQLRARNIHIHEASEGETNIWGLLELATEGDSQSEAEQHAELRHNCDTDDKASAEWLKWNGELIRLREENSYQLEKLEGENHQILTCWKASAQAYM